MFLKKLASRGFRSKSKKASSSGTAPDAIVEAIYYEEPAPESVESSEVEYIEDDEDYIQQDTDAKINGSGEEANVHTAQDKDNLLFLSVCVPLETDPKDDGSGMSHEGILTKLPPHLEEKQDRMSITASSTSEEHLTQVTASVTCSESCNTSMASDKYEGKEKKRLEDWRQIMEQKIRQLGSDNPRTFALLLEVGTMYLQHEELDRAKKYFVEAVAVSETIFQAPDLRTARALELCSIVELAEKSTSSDTPRLRRALSYLDYVYAIRYELQGKTNIDTIDTLNRIARVHMALREYSRAKEAFYEVFQLRRAVFGSSHPCAAAAARALGVAHSRLYEADAARFYFRYALKISGRNGTEQDTKLKIVLRNDLHDLNSLIVV